MACTCTFIMTGLKGTVRVRDGEMCAECASAFEAERLVNKRASLIEEVKNIERCACSCEFNFTLNSTAYKLPIGCNATDVSRYGTMYAKMLAGEWVTGVDKLKCKDSNGDWLPLASWLTLTTAQAKALGLAMQSYQAEILSNRATKEEEIVALQDNQLDTYDVNTGWSTNNSIDLDIF